MYLFEDILNLLLFDAVITKLNKMNHSDDVREKYIGYK